MIQVKTTILSKIVKSKKDFLLYDINEDGVLTNYILTNDFKRKKRILRFQSSFNHPSKSRIYKNITMDNYNNYLNQINLFLINLENNTNNNNNK